MKIVVVGVNYKDTPLNIREKGAFITRTLREGIEELMGAEAIEEVVILSTCNRSEIFAATEDPEAAVAVLRDFYTTTRSEALGDYLFDCTDREAILHLYRVVTGLDSMILGEDQILGQAKDALEKAQTFGGAGKYLTKAFREAVTFAKKVKTVYKISETPVSLSSTAVKHIKRTYPDDFSQKNILIIGSGKMGILALRYMAAEGFERVYMTNRTYHPGDEYRTIYKGVNIVEYKDRYAAIDDMDVIISATASPHTVLRRGELHDRAKPLMIIDMALPRDVEEAVGEMAEVSLLTVDDFQNLIDEKRHYREQVAKKIAREIDEEIDGLMVWITKSRVDGMVANFNDQANRLADETIEILNDRYGFTGKDEKFLRKIVHSKFREMVMPPIHQLKTLEDEDDILRFEKTIAFLNAERQA
jgi:glutamyl-tRNA reductase